MTETKRPKGRPATGRIRNTRLSIFLTEEERTELKTKAHDNGLTIADYIMQLIRQEQK